ncbi:hypothetical protein ACOSQ3_024196 [Xanthoceras sorbifolium]
MSSSISDFCITRFLLRLAIQVVAGRGAVESALSVYLEYLATTLGSQEQLAIVESLLIIPKLLILSRLFYGSVYAVQVLAINAAKDATELVAKLWAYHHTAQTKADKKHLLRVSFLFLISQKPVFNKTI